MKFMIKKGIAASKGYAIGKVFIQKNEEIVISSSNIEDVNTEIEKLKEALEISKKQLIAIKEKAIDEMGIEEAEVFEAQITLLDDPEFTGLMIKEIEENLSNAMKAVNSITNTYVAMFNIMEDAYMKERAADIKDVSYRILENLSGRYKENEEHGVMEDNIIVIAHDLTPSDTAQLDRSKVIGFATDIGGRTSHAAIMARTLEIPAVLGIGDISKEVKNGDILILDGVNGEIIINPNQEEIDKYIEKQKEYNQKREELRKLINLKAETKSGKIIEVCGNIGSHEDVEAVIENGGDGIGLFRTEFLYMDREEAPSEEEQFNSYKYVLEKMNGKKVIIRTLDIGGDKTLPYLSMPNELNPFLGYRAIRLCLDKKELFKVQIRALLRASVYGELCVMFPMISGLGELFEAKSLVNECKNELIEKNIKFADNIKWGIMIEIPSAALCAAELAQYVDFFSIGTNDLIQYTLAVDRMSEKVSYLYDPMHPAILKLIKMTIDGAHSQGKWVGMCGEMAADEEAISILLDYGIDELSMSATSILSVKKIILEHK